jgi:hypothetical protein
LLPAPAYGIGLASTTAPYRRSIEPRPPRQG